MRGCRGTLKVFFFVLMSVFFCFLLSCLRALFCLHVLYFVFVCVVFVCCFLFAGFVLFVFFVYDFYFVCFAGLFGVFSPAPH